MKDVTVVAALLCRVIDGVPHYLSVSRKLEPDSKGFPGGKIEPGETPPEALVRELFEETGLTSIVSYMLYDDTDDTGQRCQTFHVVRYEGEIQTSEKGLVEWLPRPHFTEPGLSPFYHYNRRVFALLGPKA